MTIYEQPRAQVLEAAYADAARWFVAIVMALLVGFAFLPLVLPSDFWRTPSVAVHVPSRAEIQSRIDEKVERAVQP